uniref:Uncharacterized protein n=1 Tax=Oryza glumipatula TaxID=40148 RepID=A0A0D9Y4I7_9ORYZ
MAGGDSDDGRQDKHRWLTRHAREAAQEDREREGRTVPSPPSEPDPRESPRGVKSSPNAIVCPFFARSGVDLAVPSYLTQIRGHGARWDGMEELDSNKEGAVVNRFWLEGGRGRVQWRWGGS